MESFLFAILLVVLVVRWIYLRDRIDALEGRLAVLERASVMRAPIPEFTAPPPPRPEPPPTPPTPPIVERPAPIIIPTPIQPPAAPAHRTSEDWEALIGGNWVNKLGVFV